MGATITHVALFYWDELLPFFLALNPWNKTAHIIHDEHYLVMKRYQKVPRYWYLCLLAIAYGMAQVKLTFQIETPRD